MNSSAAAANNRYFSYVKKSLARPTALFPDNTKTRPGEPDHPNLSRRPGLAPILQSRPHKMPFLRETK